MPFCCTVLSKLTKKIAKEKAKKVHAVEEPNSSEWEVLYVELMKQSKTQGQKLYVLSSAQVDHEDWCEEVKICEIIVKHNETIQHNGKTMV